MDTGRLIVVISSSAFFMVFNTVILTAFFGESFDFVRVFIGYAGSACLATGSQELGYEFLCMA